MTGSPCHDCINRRNLTWDVHITCANPPKNIAYIGACGRGMGGTYDEEGAPNFETSEDRFAYAQRVAQEKNAVVRCRWDGCGPFPGVAGFFGFDSNSVFACINKESNPEEVRT